MNETTSNQKENIHIATLDSGSSCIRALQICDHHIHFGQFCDHLLVWLQSGEKVETESNPT